MARLQILPLPEGTGDDRPPFVLVIDQVTEDEGERLIDNRDVMDGFGVKAGARAVAVFHGMTMEIPANEPSPAPEAAEVSEADFTTMATAVRRALGIDITEGEPDIAGWLLAACRELEKSEAARARLLEDRDDARTWARHGYEIGQKHCGWTDYGVAPDWLTEGWPPHFDSCEHFKRAAEYDEALTRVRGLSEHPIIMDAKHLEPNGYVHGYKEAIREAKRAARTGHPETAEYGA